MASMIYTLPHAWILEHPFVKNGHPDFYKALFYAVTGKTYDPDCKSLDCTKINVAKNIQEFWFDDVRAHGLPESALAIQLCFNGPKVDFELQNDQVEILDQAFTFADETVFSPESDQLFLDSEPDAERIRILMQAMAEYLITSETCKDAIVLLLSKGVTESELRWLHFDPNDIQDALSDLTLTKDSDPTI